MTEMFLPVLSHFENGNPWSASDGRMRFLITPEEDSTFTVQVWEGPWALEFSTVEQVERFPMTEEGLEQIPVWLKARRDEIEARPKHTLEENIARRDAAEQANQAKESQDA